MFTTIRSNKQGISILPKWQYITQPTKSMGLFNKILEAEVITKYIENIIKTKYPKRIYIVYNKGV